MVEMVIDSIRVSLMNYQRVVILKEKGTNHYLPIWIGPAEADAIAVKLQDVAVPRPLTHDLLCSVIGTLGAVVRFIVVNDLHNDTFYAKINLTVDGTAVEVDSRPSDALALAIRVQAPIYVEDSVLEKAGVYFDAETKKATSGKKENQASGKEGDEGEGDRLSAFVDFINTLDLEDFGKRKS